MALSKSITKTIYGQEVVIPNAYIKIKRISGHKGNLSVSVWTYDQADGDLIEQDSVTFVPSTASGSENFIKQAYEHLKTLDAYSDCADI